MVSVKPVSRLFLLMLCLAGVAACGINKTKDEDSPFYAVAVGSLLVLNQDVTIPGNEVAIYVQNGEILPYREVDKYQPNCKFEIFTISEKPRNVQADTFAIIKVEDDIESSSIKAATQLASLDNVLTKKFNAFGMLDQSEVFNYSTYMYLRSDKQKDVYRMICQHWESVMDDKHLSISQMRGAMGAVFTLKIKD